MLIYSTGLLPVTNFSWSGTRLEGGIEHLASGILLVRSTLGIICKVHQDEGGQIVVFLKRSNDMESQRNCETDAL